MRASLTIAAAALLLAGCGINDNPLRVARSACPAVAVLQHAGSVTLFSPAASRAANAIDVTATITDVNASCTESGGKITQLATFDVVASRRSADGARQVTLPYFAAVVRAGDRLVSKQTGTVTLDFAEGELRTTTRATARADIAETAATLPDAIGRELNRERKAGDPDAALDPLARPEVRAAVTEATFELILGFQLDEAALAYNVTK